MLRPSIFSSATYGDRRIAEPGPLTHALVERAQLLLVVRVVEAQHRHEVLGRGEAVDRPAGDALCRRIRRDEIGVIALERLELVDQRVERVVGDFRVVVDVVALFVVTNLAAELVDAGQGSMGVDVGLGSRVSGLRVVFGVKTERPET